MLKTLAALLSALSLTVQAQSFGLTVGKVTANSTSTPSYGVEFIEGNPKPGECAIRYGYNPSDAAIVALINRSDVLDEKMTYTVVDPDSGPTSVCRVERIGTIN